MISETSLKPYLLRAIYEWCTDNGMTPHLAVSVDAGTRVPMASVKNGEIVLNISFGATHGLKMDNDIIHFHARFGGVSQEIVVPVGNVIAIYAQENGQGMAFEITETDESGETSRFLNQEQPTLVSVPVHRGRNSDIVPEEGDPDPSSEPPKGGKPFLTRIK